MACFFADHQARPERPGIASCLRKFLRGAGRRRIRAFSGQQFIKDHAQGEDVTGRRDGLGFDLLRARITRSQNLERRHRKVGKLDRLAKIQNFCDTEIEQLRDAFRRDNYVAGLDVAMNDQSLMSKLNRGAKFAEKLQ